MAAFLSFLPIIVLMVASRLLPRRLALGLGLASAAATLVPWMLGGQAKHFSLTIAALIALSFVWNLAHAASAERWSGLAMTGGIALYAFASIVSGVTRPFEWAD